jgi:alkylation response protein AidB-like acyl-CoA dehydrogenase
MGNRMEIDFTPDQRKFRDELRGYFADMMDEALIRELSSGGEGGGPEFRRAMKQLGRDGLLGLSWPREYGGQERSPVEQFIFADEIQAIGFPLPFLTLNTVGPTLREYGTKEQSQYFCPRILAGEMFFAIGYSEPGAGTDLAGLQTSAVRDGDEWVINGQKMWTSLAQYADYVWLAVRTDPSVKKHRGLSVFLVPTTSEGYSRQTIRTVGGVSTNATFFDDVRVPAENLIGGENNGWRLITGQLNHERVSLMTVGRMRRNLHEVTEWARTTQVDGQPVIEKPWVQHNLARIYAKTQVLRLMNWKQAWAAELGQPQMADSSAIKVYGSELLIEAYRALLEVLGAPSILAKGSPGAVLQGRIESSYRNGLILTFGGGTNEVQRDIIAMAGMGMPHYKD